MIMNSITANKAVRALAGKTDGLAKGRTDDRQPARCCNLLGLGAVTWQISQLVKLRFGFCCCCCFYFCFYYISVSIRVRVFCLYTMLTATHNTVEAEEDKATAELAAPGGQLALSGLSKSSLQRRQ